MIYLVLAILASSIISIVMRLSNGRIKNKMLMFSVNYIVCLLCSIFFIGEISKVDRSEFTFPIWFGIVTGFLFLACFLFLELNIRKNGVVLSSTFSKLGVLVPVLISIVVFKEYPSIVKIIGIVLAIIAIVIMNLKKSDTKGFNVLQILLLLLLLLGGITDSSSTIFEHIGNFELKGFYLMIVFGSALIFSLFILTIEHKSCSYKDVLFGIGIGIPNYFSAYFLLNSLNSLPAVVVYPTYSVATIVVISIVGIFAFKERPKLIEIIGIILILAAIALLNI